MHARWSRGGRIVSRLGVASSVALVALAGTPAARPAHAAGAANKDTLYIAYPFAPASLDPAVSQDFPVVQRGVYDSLVTLDGSSPTRVVGDLATAWTASRDKTVWTFTLRRGVKFHDGTPVDAAAVKSSLTRMLTLNQGPSYIMGQFMTPSRIVVLAPDKIQFRLLPTAPVYSFLTALTSQWSNWIVSPTAVKRHAVHGDQAQGWLATHEAGSGPYVMTSYQVNQGATFTAFPGYFKGWSGHHVHRVILSFVSVDATRRELLEKGDADMSLTFTPQDLDAMKTESGLVVTNQYGTNCVYIAMTEYGPLASPKARQALAYAFDYQAFVHALLKGYGRQSTGPLPATMSAHDPGLKPYPTDLAKAKQLLQEAGVKPGTALTMWYISSDERAKQMATVMQGQLAQVGLALSIVPKDAATFSTAEAASGPALSQRPNLWAGQWTPDYDDALDFLSPLYHSRGPNAGAANAGGYHNAMVDQLLAQAARTPNAGQRQQMLNRVQRILTYDDPASVFVADVTENPVYRSNVHGFVLNPNQEETFPFYSLWKS